MTSDQTPPPAATRPSAAMPPPPLLSQAEMAELGGLRSRWSARRAMGARKGAQAGKLQGQLQREQINLAMIRSRAGSDDDPNVVAQRDHIRGIRAQINALPDVPQPGAWAKVVGSNTWVGWVDGRLLVRTA